MPQELHAIVSQTMQPHFIQLHIFIKIMHSWYIINKYFQLNVHRWTAPKGLHMSICGHHLLYIWYKKCSLLIDLLLQEAQSGS